MSSPRSTTGKIATSLVVLGVSMTFAGCGHPTEQKPTSSPAAQPPPASSSTSAAPAAAYDISRVDNVKNDFPPGFTAESHPAKTLDQQDIDGSGANPFTGAKVDPPQCRALLVPPYTDPSVGTQAAGVSAEGDQGNIDVVAFGLPKPIPASEPPAGCDHVSVSGSPEATGTAESIPAPKIDGVTTTAVKFSASDQDQDQDQDQGGDQDQDGDQDQGGDGDADEPNYIFTAALNDQTSVVVTGSTDPQLNPQQLLSDLLVKAVAAVRGQ
ncbi:MAG TPA: DUF5642 family protein [Mycobacterium sp.]|nr:DUF5642 family protein [Mycobacterium sp.]